MPSTTKRSPYKKLLFTLSLLVLSLIIYTITIIAYGNIGLTGDSCPSTQILTKSDYLALLPTSPRPFYYTTSNTTSPSLHLVRRHGYHNSYTQQPGYVFPGFNQHVTEWANTRADLEDQVKHFTFFELDIHVNEDKLMVYHLQAFDDRSSCFCLIDCLEEIKAYQVSHLNPRGVLVYIEMKAAFGTDYRMWLRGLHADQIMLVETAILSVFDVENLLLPIDVRGDFPTAREAVTERGWPSEKDFSGKTAFFFYAGSAETRGYYRKLHEDSRQRVMFLQDWEGGDDFVFAPLKPQVSLEEAERQKFVWAVDGLVERNILVSVRPDVIGAPVAENKERLELAYETLASVFAFDYNATERWRARPEKEPFERI